MTDAPRAVLDVGSNTIRLLVARVENGEVRSVLDQSEFVRLGSGVDATGELQPDRIAAANAAIRTLADAARGAGADEVTGIATSAVRDARNGRDFTDRVARETGVKIEIVSGEREAYLTYLGATIGISIDGGALVSDLGGGSAELIHADRSGVRWAVSVPLGSGRLSERFVTADPPRREDVTAIENHVREVLEGLPEAEVNRLILTGGTATHIGWLAGAKGEIQVLGIDDVSRVLDELLSRPSAQIVAQFGVKAERAEVLPAGVAAVRTIAQYYDNREMVVTLHGIREGALLDASQAGG